MSFGEEAPVATPQLREGNARGLSRSVRRQVIDLLAAKAEPQAGAREHGHRVADLAMAVAEASGEMAPDRAHRAGMLHDVGKALLPFHPGELPRRLTAGEAAVVRGHARLGARAALWAGEQEEVVAAVLYHHERFDGSGYPFGLSGSAVPLLAQAVAVADVYDALTAARSYKRQWPLHVVEAYFCVNRGKLFHPVVVDALSAAASGFGSWAPLRTRSSHGPVQ